MTDEILEQVLQKNGQTLRTLKLRECKKLTNMVCIFKELKVTTLFKGYLSTNVYLYRFINTQNHMSLSRPWRIWETIASGSRPWT